MIKRSLGSTDIDISVIGVGAFALGGWVWGPQDEADSRAALHAALDSGVTWIDTAPIYGQGLADRIVGTVVRERPVSARPLVFTKFGHRLEGGQRIHDGSRSRVVADCDTALTTLGVERIDLFQLHWPTPQPIEETAAACAELLQAGKIRAVGVSNFSVAQLDAWKATGLPLHSLQNPYSLFKPESGEAQFPWCAEHGVGGLAYSPLQRGLLTGTWTSEKVFPAGDHRGERAEYTGPGLVRALAAVEELKAIAADDDLTVAQLAIGYLLCTEGVSGVIVGARNAAQGALLGDLGMPLKQVQMEAIDAVMARWRAGA
jgi:aryl-alcohol dehydrogenase-like predicted oxidoreductase